MSESGSGDTPTPSDAEGGVGASARRVRPSIRVIDPATAQRLVGVEEGAAPRPALYLTNRLLVRGLVQGPDDSRDLDPRLTRDLAVLELDYRVTPPRRGQAGPRSPGDADDVGTGASSRVTSITLHPTDPINAVDAWSVLQQLRQADPYWIEHASLEHVIRPADGYWGGIGGYWGGIGGYWGGIGGYWGGIGGSPLQEYAMPGRGGRMPVALALPDPALRARPLARTPVVAVPDTQITPAHPWFADPTRVVRTALEGDELVVVDPVTSPVTSPVAAVPAAGSKPVDPAALLGGHGTFIAGLIRQGCPEATILSLPVMGDDGIVEEGDLLLWLEALLALHQRGQRGGRGGMVIDVLSLSMGYYAEDLTYRTGPVADLLARFARCGVAVVAGAGNDGSRDPFVPASLAAPTPRGRISRSSTPPVASVGACNPDGGTVALFSNDLELVSAVRQGVSVVSTLPLTNGMGQPSTRVAGDGGVRCTVDPDDYTGGFGVWSGTSFAAPVFAAEVAAALISQGDLTDVSDRAMCRRSIRALRACIPEEES